MGEECLEGGDKEEKEGEKGGERDAWAGEEGGELVK